jgi:hypothetical protein
MVFALDKESGELLVLSSPIEAETHCKPIDVKDGFWLFFAEDGSPLEARFENPSVPDDVIHPGRFSLERPMSGLWLQERLERVGNVSGCGLSTKEEVLDTLRANRAKRAADLSRRR